MAAVIPLALFRGCCGHKPAAVRHLHCGRPPPWFIGLQSASRRCGSSRGHNTTATLNAHRPQAMSFSIGTASSGGYGLSIQTSSRPVKPVFKWATEFSSRVAIRDSYGEYTYGSLLEASVKLSAEVTRRVRGNLQERVVIVCPNDAMHVVAQWACWISGQIAVPVSPRHPAHMLEYFATDCDTNLMVATSECEAVVKDVAVKVGCKVHIITDADRKEAMRAVDLCTDGDEQKPAPGDAGCDRSGGGGGATPVPRLPDDIGRDSDFYNESDALIIYTSSSSGSPKGVVLSFGNLESRVRALVESWEWQPRDCILHTMPLDHSQGIINSLLCPLSVGARCVMMKEFEPSDVWTELIGVRKSAIDRVNILTGTPPMYARLIEKYDTSVTKSQRMIDYIRSSCVQKIRLMTCCSSPVPKSVFNRWQQITGHQLLESYSITETGIVFSNPLHGVRTQGTVGLPLPGVYVRLVDETDGTILAEGSNIGTTVMTQYRKKKPTKAGGGVFEGIGDADRTTGLLEVRGDSVFRQYWRKPNATTREFTHDGWLKTGDIVQYKGAYLVLGQYESDIVTTGGFKVSALQVETTLLDLPGVREAAVVGLPDPTWGRKLAALVAAKEGELTAESVIGWAKGQLPDYAVPSEVRIVPAIPRNVVSGKVNKAEIATAFFPKETKNTKEEDKKRPKK